MPLARHLGALVDVLRRGCSRAQPATFRTLGPRVIGFLCSAILLLTFYADTLAGAGPPQASAEVAREWSLKGVLIAGPEERLAVLENRLRRQQAIVRVGSPIAPGVRVAWIGADHVILEVQGEPVTLRLGHSAETRPAPRALPQSVTPQGVLQRLSERLGIPVSTLERQQQQANLNWQRLWLAHRLAQRTGLSVEQVIGAFQAGQGWRALAWEYQIPVRELLRELTELRRAIGGSRP